MDLNMKGKVALVTGGAAGIGAGISESLAAEGVDIVVVDFRPIEETQAYCKSLEEKFGVRALAVKCDVSNEDQVVAAFKAAVDAFGTVDFLCSNAGKIGGAKMEDITMDYLRSYERVNIEGMMLVVKEYIRLYREQKKTSGRIVVTVSKSAFTTNSGGNACYITTKGAQASFVRGISNEVTKEGIHVNGIVPGYVRTEMTMRPEGRARQAKMDQFLRLGKEAEPEEIGAIAAFLCSDKSFQIVGAMVDCSGGCML